VRAGLFALLACASLATLACAHAEGSNRATVAIYFSRFEPDVVVARAGDPLTITLRNDDPIEHEWIVGPAAVHERHRTGTEPYHDERPTEVTVPAFSSKVTTVTFDVPGEYAYICHLPGHEEYGMKGTLRVVD
jgi:plastocyanin